MRTAFFTRVPCKGLKRKEFWEWLFQLAISFVGRHNYEEWLEKQNKWRNGLLGMLYLGNQKCWYNTLQTKLLSDPIRSAGVGPNRKTRKLGYYNGNWGLPKTVYEDNWGHGSTPLSSKATASQINDFTGMSNAWWLDWNFQNNQRFCGLWSQYVCDKYSLSNS